MQLLQRKYRYTNEIKKMGRVGKYIYPLDFISLSVLAESVDNDRSQIIYLTQNAFAAISRIHRTTDLTSTPSI